MTTEVNTMVSRKRQVYQPERRVSSLRNKNNRGNRSGSNTQNNYSKRGGSKLQLGPPIYETVDGKRLESKHYSKEEFSKLNRGQRQAVIKLNRERRNRAYSESGNNDSPNGQHNISAIEAISDDLQSLQIAVVAAMNSGPSQADRT